LGCIRQSYLIEEGNQTRALRNHEIDIDYAEEVKGVAINILRQHGPQTSTSIKKYLPKEHLKKTNNNIVGHVLRWAESLGEVEYGNVGVDSWRKSDKLFSIVPELEIAYTNQKQSDMGLTQWYFRQYGPATEQDFIWWTGLTVTRSRRAFRSIAMALTEVKIKDYSFPNAPFYMLTEKFLELKNTSSTDIKNMVRFLPYEDALLKAYKLTRNRFFGFHDSKLSTFITSGGEAKPSVWLNGQVIGLWEWTNKKDRVMNIMIPNRSELKPLFEEEATSVQEFIEASEINWQNLSDDMEVEVTPQKKRSLESSTPKSSKKKKKSVK